MTPHELLLVQLTAAIGPADWTRFAALVDAARDGVMSRAQVEEALLQATLFYGFPRAISAFETLGARWPASRAADDAGCVAPAEQRAAGERLFARIYGEHTVPVREKLAALHAEFHDFVIESAYGRILARTGLEPRVRELCAVAALATLAQTPQLIAHARGALRCGATAEEVSTALRTVLAPDAVAQLERKIAGLRDRPPG